MDNADGERSSYRIRKSTTERNGDILQPRILSKEPAQIDSTDNQYSMDTIKVLGYWDSGRYRTKTNINPVIHRK